MNTVSLGRTGVPVTAVGMGAASIGNLHSAVDDDTAAAAVGAAWDEGVRYFDAAPHYGLGLAERRLGRALADQPRETFTVSTKVGRLLVPNPHPTGSDLAAADFDVPDTLTRVRDYSRDGVLRSLESSLARLGMDRVDIVYVHDPEDYLDAALGQAIPALIRLREEGVVGAVGAGMNLVDPLIRIVAETDVDVVMVAGRWTLIDRSAEPLLQACQQRDVSVVCAAPFNSGVLVQPWPADDALFNYRRVPPEVLARARLAAGICRRYGASLPQAAMQFPLRHPAVAAVVTGPRTAEQMRQSATWMRSRIPDAAWAELDQAPVRT